MWAQSATQSKRSPALSDEETDDDLQAMQYDWSFAA
jgi:hypothetical protein